MMLANEFSSSSTWSITEIAAAVNQYMAEFISQLPLNPYQEVSFEIKQLDTRMQMEACDHPLDVSPYPSTTKPSAKRMTLKVECQHPNRWRVFIPIHLAQTDRVVISQQAIQRNTPLNQSLLSYRQMDTSLLRQGYYTDIEEVLGFEAKRFISQGESISPNKIQAPQVVRKQQTVSIISQSSALTVKTSGIALSDGRVGDWIKVRNRSSNRIVEGQISPNGEVIITF